MTERPALRREAAWLWQVCAFSSAWLLFVAEPLLGKWLLPSFGGSPGTWAACMLFFQCCLLAGYAYAWLLSRLAAGAALAIHALLAAAVALFVVRAGPLVTAPPTLDPPLLRIAQLLTATAGLPYLLLSSTAPLLQAWAARLGAAVPHRLYAISNLGSLAALLAYPWLIEGAWPLPVQYRLWLAGCAVLAALSLSCAIATAKSDSSERTPLQPVAARDAVYWLACAFVPSVFLLAATDYITTDLSVTPALWLLPLSLYLLSFIAAFSGITARFGTWLLAGWVLASIGLGYTAFAGGSAQAYRQLGCVLSALTLSGLLCHDALVRARPEPGQLPLFYLCIALGGALGAGYVSGLAPVWLNDYYELELACALSYGLLLWQRARSKPAPAERRWLFLGVGIAMPLLAASTATRAGLTGRGGAVLERRRSLLGALRVSELDVGRVLTHGRIRHGMQLKGPERARWPTMYFGPGTAISQVLTRHAQGRPRTLGIVGLGVGTLAAYGGERDRLHFYELDPNVLDLAQQYFTFLRDTPAHSEFVLGDGRLMLASEPAQRFDVLVLDAFASDSVPVHLLTREAFDLYVQRLAPDGVLLANVSNRHLAIDRVVRAAARAHGYACTVVETGVDVTRFVSKVRWAVMARDPAQLAAELAGLEPAAPSGSDVLWTDARASLWSILK